MGRLRMNEYDAHKHLRDTPRRRIRHQPPNRTELHVIIVACLVNAAAWSIVLYGVMQ